MKVVMIPIPADVISKVGDPATRQQPFLPKPMRARIPKCRQPRCRTSWRPMRAFLQLWSAAAVGFSGRRSSWPNASSYGSRRPAGRRVADHGWARAGHVGAVFRLAFLAKAQAGNRVSGLCLAAAAIPVALPLQAFTLAWTHSIGKIRWEEDYRLAGGRIELVEARIRGHGAGMEPPEGLVLKNGVWHYTPRLPPAAFAAGAFFACCGL